MILRRLLPISILAVSLAISAPGQTNSQAPAQSPAAAPAAYPDSLEGLQQLLRDILAAAQAGENQKVDAFVKNLILPDHKAWFVRVFGPEEGERLAFEYLKDLFEFEGRTRLLFTAAARQKAFEVEVSRLTQTTEPTTQYLNTILAAMKEPQPLYRASLRRSEARNGVPVGYFVYADGGFRRIDLRVLGALSSLPPPHRITVGGTVRRFMLIYNVQPRYPIDAQMAGIQGTVKLRAIITKEGTVRELKVVSGHPLLVDAAITAVREWRYSPTLLGGEPVEVVTTIDVVFTLGR